MKIAGYETINKEKVKNRFNISQERSVCTNSKTGNLWCRKVAAVKFSSKFEYKTLTWDPSGLETVAGAVKTKKKFYKHEQLTQQIVHAGISLDKVTLNKFSFSLWIVELFKRNFKVLFKKTLNSFCRE